MGWFCVTARPGQPYQVHPSQVTWLTAAGKEDEATGLEGCSVRVSASPHASQRRRTRTDEQPLEGQGFAAEARLRGVMLAAGISQG